MAKETSEAGVVDFEFPIAKDAGCLCGVGIGLLRACPPFSFIQMFSLLVDLPDFPRSLSLSLSVLLVSFFPSFSLPTLFVFSQFFSLFLRMFSQEPLLGRHVARAALLAATSGSGSMGRDVLRPLCSRKVSKFNCDSFGDFGAAVEASASFSYTRLSFWPV